MIATKTYRRRAIYTALKPFLSEPEMLNALRLWEDTYSASPRFTLQRFLSDICVTTQLRSRRSDMLLSLVNTMNMPESSLLPDPTDAMQAWNESSGGKDVLPVETRCFCALMEALMENIPGDIHHRFRLDYLNGIDRQTLPFPASRAMHVWLAEQYNLKMPTTEPGALRQLLNVAYVILCELVGPVNTDKLLTRAVSAVEVRDELAGGLAKLL